MNFLKIQIYNGLNDADAFENVAFKILGKKEYARLKKEAEKLSKKAENDLIVDRIFRKLNHPIIKIIMALFGR